MKSLLLSIQNRLHETISYLPYRNKDLRAIYIVSDENDLPNESPFPCYGLKDGDITYEYYGGSRGETLFVTLIGYASYPDQEISMIGKGDSRGVFDLIEDAKNALNKWIPEGFATSDLLSESKSIRLIKMDPNMPQEQWPFLQKKTAMYKFWREVQAP